MITSLKRAVQQPPPDKEKQQQQLHQQLNQQIQQIHQQQHIQNQLQQIQQKYLQPQFNSTGSPAPNEATANTSNSVTAAAKRTGKTLPANSNSSNINNNSNNNHDQHSDGVATIVSPTQPQRPARQNSHSNNNNSHSQPTTTTTSSSPSSTSASSSSLPLPISTKPNAIVTKQFSSPSLTTSGNKFVRQASATKVPATTTNNNNTFLTAPNNPPIKRSSTTAQLTATTNNNTSSPIKRTSTTPQSPSSATVTVRRSTNSHPISSTPIEQQPSSPTLSPTATPIITSDTSAVTPNPSPASPIPISLPTFASNTATTPTTTNNTSKTTKNNSSSQTKKYLITTRTRRASSVGSPPPGSSPSSLASLITTQSFPIASAPSSAAEIIFPTSTTGTSSSLSAPSTPTGAALPINTPSSCPSQPAEGKRSAVRGRQLPPAPLFLKNPSYSNNNSNSKSNSSKSCNNSDNEDNNKVTSNKSPSDLKIGSNNSKKSESSSSLGYSSSNSSSSCSEDEDSSKKKKKKSTTDQNGDENEQHNSSNDSKKKKSKKSKKKEKKKNKKDPQNQPVPTVLSVLKLPTNPAYKPTSKTMSRAASSPIVIPDLDTKTTTNSHSRDPASNHSNSSSNGRRHNSDPPAPSSAKPTPAFTKKYDRKHISACIKIQKAWRAYYMHKKTVGCNRSRYKIASEILSTESHYVQCLKTVTDAPSLKVYTVYSHQYAAALSVLKHLKDEKPDFVKFLMNCKNDPSCNKLDLESFLIMPIQRVPRYELLVKEMLKNTLPTHCDYPDLTTALSQIMSVASYINEKRREFDTSEKVLSIQESLVGRPGETLLVPHRKFVAEGDVLEITSAGSEKERYLFLFNDLLVTADKRKNILNSTTKFHHEKDILLKDASVSDMKDPKKEVQRFSLMTADNAVHMFRCYTSEVKEKWLSDIQSAIQSNLQTIKS